jgi:hypothetical protein
MQLVLLPLLQLVVMVGSRRSLLLVVLMVVLLVLLLELGTDSYTEVVPAPQGGRLW